MASRFSALLALCRDEPYLTTDVSVYIDKDMVPLGRHGIDTVADLQLLDDPSVASHYAESVLTSLYSRLLRHLLEERANGTPLEADFLSDIAFELVYKAIPLYAYRLPVEALPFISVRTLNCLLRVGISIVSALEGANDEQLYRIRNFGRTSLQNLKASLLTISDSLDIAAAVGQLSASSVNPFINDTNPLSVDTDVTDVIEPNLTEHDRLLPAPSVTQTQPPTPVRFVDCVNQLKAMKDPRQRAIIDDRLGYEKPSLTLEQAGARHGITRERIRQIVAKVGKLAPHSTWPTEAQGRLTRLLADRDEPLYFDLVESEDDWFSGVGIHARFYAGVLKLNRSFGLKAWDLGQRTIITHISYDEWLECVGGTRHTVTTLSIKGLKRSDVRLVCEARLVKYNAVELTDILLNALGPDFIYSDNENDPILISTTSRTSALLRGLVDEATEPFTLEHIQQRLLELGSPPKSLGTIRNTLAGLDVQQIGGGRYATFRMLWSEWDTSLDQACDTAAQICNDLPTRQFHASELFDILDQVDGDSLRKIKSYQELNVLLREKAQLTYLSRYVWRANSDIQVNAQRIDIQQALLRIVEEAGRPLTHEQIFSRLRQYRGISRFSLIIPTPEFLRTAPATWGLFSRDFLIDGVGLEAMTAAAHTILKEQSLISEMAFVRRLRSSCAMVTARLTDFMIMSILTTNRAVRRLGRSGGALIEAVASDASDQYFDDEGGEDRADMAY